MKNYFKVSELCKSDTATSKGINNSPTVEEIKNMENLIKTLNIIREAWGSPIIVNSGFRNKELNKAVGGSSTSWHLQGMAADIKCSNNKALWDLIVKLNKEGKINFTELINEKANSNGTPQWIHIAVNPSNLKNQIKYIK